jgi:hypothetical protein
MRSKQNLWLIHRWYFFLTVPWIGVAPPLMSTNWACPLIALPPLVSSDLFIGGVCATGENFWMVHRPPPPGVVAIFYRWLGGGGAVLGGFWVVVLGRCMRTGPTCTDPTHDHSHNHEHVPKSTNLAKERFGIDTFVYRARRCAIWLISVRLKLKDYKKSN